MRLAIGFAFVVGAVVGYFGGSAIKRYIDSKREDVPYNYETYGGLRKKRESQDAETAEKEYSQESEEPKQEEIVVKDKDQKCTMISIKKFSSADESEWKKIYLTFVPDTDTLVDSDKGIAYDDPNLFYPIMAEVFETVKQRGAAYIKNEKEKTLYEVAVET